MAAFMACGHAKFTGEAGVCLATSGPGAIHLLNGLYDAKMDRQPVVALVGQQSRSALGGHYQQEVDLVSLFKDVAAEYVQMVSTAAQLRHVVDSAFRIALSRRCPTCIILPIDVQELEAKQPAREHGTVHSGVGYAAPRVVPSRQDLERAAQVLNAGERPVVLEAIVDPNVPPLPPHITLEQARNYLKAILKGDPDAVRIIKTSLKEMLA